MKIQRIFIYPIKSLGPVEVQAAEITNEGLRFDRQYVLAKPPGEKSGGIVEHLTIKTTFELSLFQQSIDSSWSGLTIKHTTAQINNSLTVPLTPSPLTLLSATTYQVSIFGTQAPGIDMGDRMGEFFTEHLRQPVRLLYIGGSGQREIPGSVFIKRQVPVSMSVNDKLQPQRIRFADAAPLLVTSTASEEDARMRLPPFNRGEDVIFRFRPNIHVDVEGEQEAFEEDYWSLLSVRSQTNTAQEVSIRCLFRAVRCLSLNVDVTKGGMISRNRQLYGLLARDRRVNELMPNRPVFGQYACAGPSGAVLRVGDQVEITERSSRMGSPAGNSPTVHSSVSPIRVETD